MSLSFFSLFLSLSLSFSLILLVFGSFSLAAKLDDVLPLNANTPTQNETAVACIRVSTTRIVTLTEPYESTLVGISIGLTLLLIATERSGRKEMT